VKRRLGSNTILAWNAGHYQHGPAMEALGRRRIGRAGGQDFPAAVQQLKTAGYSILLGPSKPRCAMAVVSDPDATPLPSTSARLYKDGNNCSFRELVCGEQSEQPRDAALAVAERMDAIGGRGPARLQARADESIAPAAAKVSIITAHRHPGSDGFISLRLAFGSVGCTVQSR